MSDFADFDEADPYAYDEDNATCKHCQADGLTWHHTGERWRLLDPNGRFHVCTNDAAVDDFEVLT